MFLPLLFLSAVVGFSAAVPKNIAPSASFVDEESPNSVYFKKNDPGPSFHAFGKSSWFLAQAVCAQDDMTLAKITDKGENEEVKKFVNTLDGTEYPGPFWTMANKLYDGSSWTFSLTEAVDYFNWGPNEPTTADSQDCIEFHKDGTWYNTECSTENYILCEKI